MGQQLLHFQLFRTLVVISLVSSSSCCVLSTHTHTHPLRNDSVVFGQNHINQKEIPFGSGLFAQIFAPN